MKASKFIRDNGIQAAAKVINSAPGNAESYWGGYYFREKPDFQFHNGIHEYWNLTENNGEYFKKRGFEPVIIKDLKRLVESVDYLNEWYSGKIDDAYDHVERMYGMLKLRPQFPNLHDRIKLVEGHLSNYESIYGVSHA
ncbi:hypothetical protein SLJ91_01340 [Acinetobacter pittii]|uniref:hypothetical protein n=1 Tax=Acinetobacter pittii TaxID=48296 RepID=UPI00204CCD3B|nr:hypothetical protein [Acinetobacter pittii]MDX8202066.1 hypothetical protein [Acinetobacter pittii]MDX8227748.1 hypothetical protein [Acinetobacter pittii]WPP79894.1 hypothetical protein SOI79_13560 [Acinetobacter pittii]DAI74952.1 MAG TPA: hypothetical protein [Caudoviricetes sp.]